MEFLDLVETIAARDASLERLYAREGFRFRGYGRDFDKRRKEALDRKLYETVRFLHAVYNGKIGRHHLLEAMTTSDFPLLFGTVIDRQTLGSYREWPATWRNIARVVTVPDFRSVERSYDPFGGDARLTEVHELEEYPASYIDEQSPFTYKVKKYGRRMPFSWEVMVNDVTNRLKDAPIRFGRAAVRSEQYFVTSLYVSSTGPSTAVYTNGNKNIVNTTNGAATNNPALSILGLQDAFNVLARQTDPVSGEAIMIEAVVLEVPPALNVVAQNILNATQIIIGADSAEQRILTNNWMRNNVTLVVNPSLSQINTTNGNTAWYLHAASNTGRPLLEVGFLAGYETPQIFMKSPNAVRVGAGALVDPMQGDFDNDSIDYKIRHVFGGSIVDVKASVASEGDGT